MDTSAEVTIDDQGRPEPPVAADETATLLGFLDFQRATFAWKCSGLDAAGLSATVGVSSMTLGGMLKHLALVERNWLPCLFAPEPGDVYLTSEADAEASFTVINEAFGEFRRLFLLNGAVLLVILTGLAGMAFLIRRRV